jgi:carboxypeptidase PM20D1
MNRFAVGLAAIAALGAGVIAFRTATFAPADIADSAGIKLAPAPAFDVQAAARNLGAAIRFQTVSHQDPAENQTGEWDKLHAWLAQAYPQTHAAMNRVLIGQSLLYRWQGSDPAAQPIIVMAHQDVVPITPGTEKDWKRAPFAGEIADGAVWGRGAIDDKGSLVALFEAIEALARQGFKPRRTIYLVSGHDEEVGGTGAKAIADRLARDKVRALFTIDEGSAVIADTPVIDGPAIMIGVAEKGYATLRIEALAKGGHSSMPPKEIGTVNLAKAVVAINDNQFPLEVEGPAAAMLEVLAAEKGGLMKAAVANRWLFGPLVRAQAGSTPASAAGLHTTIAPTMLSGSPKENVLPQTATALINFRIAPWNRSSDVMARARQAVGDLPVILSFNREPREPSPVSSSTSAGWKLIRAAAEAEQPGAVVSPYLVVAGTDSRSMTPVSDDVYRFAPMLLKTSETAMIHGTNEHMTLANLERMIRFYARLIATAAG